MKEKKAYILALDLGGTRFRVALADDKGKMLDRFSDLTHTERGKEWVLANINQALHKMLSGVSIEQVRAMSVSAPGPLEPFSGVLLRAPNMPGWYNVPLKAIWEKELGIPVFVSNDANLGALGEHRFGVGKGINDLVYITVSTGVGGGVISQGRLLLGWRGLAGEVGHMTVDPNGPRCICGNMGCLEVLASGSAIARQARERMKRGDDTIISSMVSGNIDGVTGETVTTAAKKGDALALEIVSKAAFYLGIGIVSLVHLLNPKLIVIGGGVSNLGSLLFEPVRALVGERAIPDFLEGLEILPTSLGDNVSLMGAIALVLDGTSG